MSKKSSSSRTSCSTTSYPSIKPEDYKHSPIHYVVVLGDQTGLSRLLSTLPALVDPSTIHTETDSLQQDHVADQISSVIDRRDVPFRETPLHLAVRLGDLSAACALTSAGADVTLQNAAGWNPLQEALCRRSSEMTGVLVAHHHATAWSRWRRRLPRVIAVLRRMRDFYMEMSFHFESSVIPFVGKIAPSDTYKIWKRDGNLRADTSLAGFDGLKIQRADRSFFFLGEGDTMNNVSPGALLILHRDKRKIFNAFANADSPMSDDDIDKFLSQSSVYRPGMDMTKAELVGKSNWRWQEKTETVGEWKAKVYDVHNVVFSMRTRKVAENDVAGSEQVLPLELDEDDDGFLVAEINNNSNNIEINNLNLKSNNSHNVNVRNNINVNGDRRRHSSFVKEEREFIYPGRRSVDLVGSRKSVSGRGGGSGGGAVTATKEKEIVKSLRPSVWLTEQFPLKTEELLPLLDILANKVKAVRRMRELLTTKFPPGTFPVKIAIPVVPTVRVVITFTKFIELQPTEQFFTPFSSPVHFQAHLGKGISEEDPESDTRYQSNPSSSSSSSSSWLRRSTSRSTGGSKDQQRPSPAHIPDPFVIPSDYTWTRAKQSRKGKNTKSTKKPK